MSYPPGQQPPGQQPPGQPQDPWQRPPQYGQQPYPQGGHPQYPPPGQQYGQQPGRRPRRQTWIRRHPVLVTAGCAAIIAVIGIAAAAGHKPPPSSAAPPAQPAAATSATTSTAARPAPARAAAVHKARPHVVATFRGSGIRNTPKFTVTDTWKLQYSFSCASFGSPGNFQVYEDGGNDFSLEVNELAMSKTASTWAYSDSGQHYLEVNSECDWTLKVIDEP